jgi:hypothetical protein
MRSMRIGNEALPPPPGIIGSIRTGFDAIATHVAIILVPFALDLLVWLGPRVSFNKVGQPLLQQFQSLAASSGLQAADVQSMLDVYREIFKNFNLLAMLRTFPIGIFSLMSGRMPLQSPLGSPTVIQVDSSLQLLGLLLILTFLGWMLGALYFQWVASIVDAGDLGEGPPPAAHAVLQTLLYSFIWLALVWSVGLPLMFVLYILFAINSLLGEGVLLFLAFVALWLVVPLFFSPHGIFLHRQNAFASFLGSFRLTRFTLPTSSLFVLTVFLMGIGLNILWSVPEGNSWLALVGIFGHAFITTALLASSFVYYRDMTNWLQLVLSRIRAAATPPTAPS